VNVIATDVKRKFRLCSTCGHEGEGVGCRPATAEDIPELAHAHGPILYVVMFSCGNCGRVWIVLASESGGWYGMEAHD
jgi:hypothetical protein